MTQVFNNQKLRHSTIWPKVIRGACVHTAELARGVSLRLRAEVAAVNVWRPHATQCTLACGQLQVTNIWEWIYKRTGSLPKFYFQVHRVSHAVCISVLRFLVRMNLFLLAVWFAGVLEAIIIINVNISILHMQILESSSRCVHNRLFLSVRVNTTFFTCTVYLLYNMFRPRTPAIIR
jgi:hypothetical protein